MAFLVVTQNDEEIARHPLSAGAFTIGRSPSCNICLDHRALSRTHARLEVRGDSFVIRDLGSQNGTWVNGEKLENPQAVRPGDKIKIGRFHLFLEAEDEPRSSGRQMVAVITVRAEGAAPASFALLSDEIIFGRTDTVDVTLPSPKISRRHCQVRRAGAFFVLRDLGSQNGTFFNNKRMTRPAPLVPGDTFLVEPFTITIDEQEMDLPEEEAPAEDDPEAPMQTAMFLGPAELRDLAVTPPAPAANERKAQLAEWQKELRDRVLAQNAQAQNAQAQNAQAQNAQAQNAASGPPPLPSAKGDDLDAQWDDSTRGIPAAKVIRESDLDDTGGAPGRPTISLTLLSGEVIEEPMHRTMMTVGDTPDCDIQLSAGDYPTGVSLVLVATEDGNLALIHLGRGQPPVVRGLEADRVLLEPGETAVLGSFELSWR